MKVYHCNLVNAMLFDGNGAIVRSWIVLHVFCTVGNDY